MTYCQHQSAYGGWNNSVSPMSFPAQSNFAPNASQFQQNHRPGSGYSHQHAQPNYLQQQSQSNHSQPNYSQHHAQPNCSQQHAQPSFSQEHVQPNRSQQQAQTNLPHQNSQQSDAKMSQADVDAVLNSMKNFACPRGCFPPGMVDSMSYNSHNSDNNSRNHEKNANHHQNGSYNQSIAPNNHIVHNANTPRNHNHSLDSQCSNNFAPQRNHNQMHQNIGYQGHQKSHDQCSHSNPQNNEYLAHVSGHGHMKPQQVYQQPSAQEEPHISALHHLHDEQRQEVSSPAHTHGNMCGEGNIYENSKTEAMFPVICSTQKDDLHPVGFLKTGLRSDGLQGSRTRSAGGSKGWLIGPPKTKSSPKRSFC